VIPTVFIPALLCDDALYADVIAALAGRALADALPHAHFHALPVCEHLPTLERPADEAALFAGFLDDEGL